jgi:hypothetical protein
MIFEVRCAKAVGLWALVIICIGFFGLFIWPTPYRYDHIDYGSGTSYPVRQNRLTGSSKVLFPNGWRTVSQEELGAADLGKLDTHAELSGAGSHGGWSQVRLDIYNGSDFTIKEITIEVLVGDANKKEIIDRRYRPIIGGMVSSSEIPPLHTGFFTFELGLDVMADYHWSYRVVGAKGIRN